MIVFLAIDRTTFFFDNLVGGISYVVAENKIDASGLGVSWDKSIMSEIELLVGTGVSEEVRTESTDVFNNLVGGIS